MKTLEIKFEYKTLSYLEYSNKFDRFEHNRKCTTNYYLNDSLKQDGQIYPVLVYLMNEKFYIIDGQHRWKYLKDLKNPIELKIYYDINSHELSEEDVLKQRKEFIDKVIRASNSTSRNWNNLQHLKWSSNFREDPKYTIFLTLKEKYKKLDINYLYYALKNDQKIVFRPDVGKDVRQRSLNFNEKNINFNLIENVNMATGEIINFQKQNNYKGCRTKREINFAMHQFYISNNKNLSIAVNSYKKLFQEEIEKSQKADIIYQMIIDNL